MTAIKNEGHGTSCVQQLWMNILMHSFMLLHSHCIFDLDVHLWCWLCDWEHLRLDRLGYWTSSWLRDEMRRVCKVESLTLRHLFIIHSAQFFTCTSLRRYAWSIQSLDRRSCSVRPSWPFASFLLLTVLVRSSAWVVVNPRIMLFCNVSTSSLWLQRPKALSRTDTELF